MPPPSGDGGPDDRRDRVDRRPIDERRALDDRPAHPNHAPPPPPSQHQRGDGSPSRREENGSGNARPTSGGPSADGAAATEPNSSTQGGSEFASQPVNLFVRNVAKHVMEDQLIELFSKYGNVDSAVVVRDPHSKECRGFGFVKVKTEEDAVKVLEAVQNFDFEGRQISVERAKRTEPHSRTPGTYLGMDRRIRDRYAGMKRHREYGYDYLPPPPPYGGGPPHMSRPYSRDGYDPRPRYDGMGWPDSRGEYPPRGGSYYPPRYDDRRPDERERSRRRYDDGPGAPPPPPNPGPRYPPREAERDDRVAGREPPVPRESADDVI